MPEGSRGTNKMTCINRRFGRKVFSLVNGLIPTDTSESRTLIQTRGGTRFREDFLFGGERESESARARKKRFEATEMATSWPSNI